MRRIAWPGMRRSRTAAGRALRRGHECGAQPGEQWGLEPLPGVIAPGPASELGLDVITQANEGARDGQSPQEPRQVRTATEKNQAQAWFSCLRIADRLA